MRVFASEAFDVYCNLSDSVWDSWVSASSAGALARGRSEVVSLPWYSPHPSLPPSLSLADASLADYVQTCPGRNAPTFLMHFYVQAIWQWRAPSFCSINISFPIWLQIWGQHAPEYKWTGRLSPWKNNGGPPPRRLARIWFVCALDKYGGMRLGLIENHCHCKNSQIINKECES